MDSAAAAPLADACVTTARLEALASAVPATALQPAITWLAASTGSRALLAEISQAVTRIHDLIGAMKGFTQMDRPLVAEPMHVGTGVRDAATVMSPKAHARSVMIEVDVPDELPLINGSAADLNQVWACLIDNALDAAPTASRVTISARRAGGNVVVSVIDGGAGVPESIRNHIFDPFFTTKPIGEGRGLGLDIARRIVSLIDGQIDFDSVAGRTEFRVSLPITGRTSRSVEPGAIEEISAR
jgi:signal transduction histidine kinase